VQPAFMQAIRQSQQPWIMSQQALSPLVQVTQQPSLVISTLQAPIVRLQQHTILPFIMQLTLHSPPAIMVQRFCIMVQAATSSHMQVIFMPPAHFSTFMVQRGTITMFGVVAGMLVPIGIVAPMPVIALRSIIIVVVMILSPQGFSGCLAQIPCHLRTFGVVLQSFRCCDSKKSELSACFLHAWS
jgi:hypothetical protein